MMNRKAKKIIGLLGIGFDAEDGHIRITRGEHFDVILGSDESHAYMHQLIRSIEEQLSDRGLSLDDIDPEEFADFIKSVR